MDKIFYIFLLTFLIADFVLENVLDWLNAKSSKEPIPAELQGIYDTAEYDKQQRYFRTNLQFSRISSAVSFVLSFVLLAFGLFGWLDVELRNYIENPYWLMLAFFGIIYVGSSLLSLPFDYYAKFVIEEKFGFNKSTKKIFWLDTLKSFLLSAVLMGGIASLILLVYLQIPTYFWILAWGVIFVISLLLNMFYSDVIVPLFNKQTPLEEGELRSKIENFAQKAGFKLDNIYVIDGSKRSTKANAYFSGMGPRKRVVLYDTLINDLSHEEIVAVLAHEIGHYKRKHLVKTLVMTSAVMLLQFYLLSLFLGNKDLAVAMGGEEPSFHLGIFAFFLLYSPISTFLNIIINVFSRKHEYEADAYAAMFGMADKLISSLRTLSKKSLSNLTPHSAYVFVNYSHPTLYQRIKALKKK